MFLSNTKQMSTNQQDTLTESLISLLKKIISKIGNEGLHNLLNDLLPNSKKIQELTYSEKEMFELVTLSLSNLDAETLELKLNKHYEEILSEKHKLSPCDTSFLMKLFSLVCAEMPISEKVIEKKFKSSTKEKHTFSIFCFISNSKYYYNSKQLSKFLNISVRQIERHVSFMDNLNPKIPTEKLLIEKLEQVKEKINTNLN